MVAPSTHFVPQRRYGATFGLVFSEPNARDYSELRKYYDKKGVEFFRMSFDNPALGIGFYRMGQLTNIDAYRINSQLREDVRNQIRGAHIVDWKINE